MEFLLSSRPLCFWSWTFLLLPCNKRDGSEPQMRLHVSPCSGFGGAMLDYLQFEGENGERKRGEKGREGGNGKYISNFTPNLSTYI